MRSLEIKSLFNVPKLSLYLEKVDGAISKSLVSDNPFINEPLSRLIKSHGKRLRPALLIAVVFSQKKQIDQSVISACAAIELIHIGSLVHDDIIDNADARRNVPTINSQEGEDRALVIGDYLLAKACVEGAKISGLIGEKIASTIAKLCDGESRELASQYNVNRSQTDYLLAIEGKTASLFAAACEIGGMCAGLDSSSISSLEKYGREFGMSFQLIDDLIDLLSTAELLGKPVGNDLKEGVYTMPILLALSGNSRKRLAALLTNKKQIVLDEVVNSLVNDQSIQRTLLYAKKYNKLAVKALSKSPGDYANLIELPDAYLNYCLENLVAKKYRSTVSGS